MFQTVQEIISNRVYAPETRGTKHVSKNNDLKSKAESRSKTDLILIKTTCQNALSQDLTRYGKSLELDGEGIFTGVEGDVPEGILGPLLLHLDLQPLLLNGLLYVGIAVQVVVQFGEEVVRVGDRDANHVAFLDQLSEELKPR